MAATPLTQQLNGYWKMADDLGSGKFAASALTPAGAKLKQIAISEYQRATGRRGMRIGRNRRLARASARYTVKRSTTPELRVQMTPPGVWAIVENGAAPHVINGRRGKKKVLAIGPSGRMAYSPVNHPGMGSLGKPIAATSRQVPRVWMVEQGRQVTRYL